MRANIESMVVDIGWVFNQWGRVGQGEGAELRSEMAERKKLVPKSAGQGESRSVAPPRVEEGKETGAWVGCSP